MDRALFATAIAFSASLHCFTDLILHNRFLQAPQQALCVFEEKAQIFGAKLVWRTATSTDIAPPGLSFVKRRLDKNAYIHGGSRLFPNVTLTRRPPVLPTTVFICERACKPLDMSRTSGRDQTVLGQVSTQGVDHLVALAEKHLPCSKQHGARLLIFVFTGTKRMVGRNTASTIASASATSFF